MNGTLPLSVVVVVVVVAAAVVAAAAGSVVEVVALGVVEAGCSVVAAAVVVVLALRATKTTNTKVKVAMLRKEVSKSRTPLHLLINLMAYSHCWIRTLVVILIQTANPLATLHYAEVFTLHRVRFRFQS